MSVSSHEELAVEIERRNGTFTDIEIAYSPLDVSGPQAAVEWVAFAVFSGPLELRGSHVLAPTSHRVRVRAITVANSTVTRSARSGATGTISDAPGSPELSRRRAAPRRRQEFRDRLPSMVTRAGFLARSHDAGG